MHPIGVSQRSRARLKHLTFLLFYSALANLLQRDRLLSGFTIVKEPDIGETSAGFVSVLTRRTLRGEADTLLD